MADYAIHDTTLTGISNVIRKKDGTVALIDPADYADRINLMGLLEEKSASGSIVTFSDGADDVPLKSCEVALPPSLDGYNSVTVYHTDGQTPPVFSEEYTADLGRTIYGGTADVVNGTGKETHARIKISDLNWTYYTGGTNPIFYAMYVPNMKICEREEMPSIFIDGYVTRTAHSRSYLSANMADMECSAIENFQTITFRNDAYTSVSDMLAVLGDEYIVYELATTTDFTFSPVEISSRLGNNTMWSDSGDTEVTYRASGTVTPVVPTLISKTITANGTYSASDDGVDGYSEVTVNVPTPSLVIEPIMGNNVFISQSGVSGTDVERTARTFNITKDGKIIFADGSYGYTNTGSNHGFIDIRHNDVSVVKQYLTTNTNTSITIPDIDVENGDTVAVVVGFDSNHSSCNFQLYSAMVMVSEQNPSMLSMMPSEEVNENTEEVEENEQNESEG